MSYYEWTAADTRACDALVRAGTLKYDEPTTVVSAIEAAKAAERKRIEQVVGKYFMRLLEAL